MCLTVSTILLWCFYPLLCPPWLILYMLHSSNKAFAHVAVHKEDNWDSFLWTEPWKKKHCSDWYTVPSERSTPTHNKTFLSCLQYLQGHLQVVINTSPNYSPVHSTSLQHNPKQLRTPSLGNQVPTPSLLNIEWGFLNPYKSHRR